MRELLHVPSEQGFWLPQCVLCMLTLHGEHRTRNQIQGKQLVTTRGRPGPILVRELYVEAKTQSRKVQQCRQVIPSRAGR